MVTPPLHLSHTHTLTHTHTHTHTHTQDPLIDSFSDDGIIPDEFEGNIKLSDVVFHYPARPSVQVTIVTAVLK